jgi:hypothetical protein
MTVVASLITFLNASFQWEGGVGTSLTPILFIEVPVSGQDVLFAIVLSVLRFAVSDYPYGIFKLVLHTLIFSYH